jgi:hypothetical protein
MKQYFKNIKTQNNEGPKETGHSGGEIFLHVTYSLGEKKKVPYTVCSQLSMHGLSGLSLDLCTYSDMLTILQGIVKFA